MLNMTQYARFHADTWNHAFPIYSASFLEEERKSDEQVKNLHDQGRYTLYVGEAGGETIGMALAGKLQDFGMNLVLLDYIAIRPAARGTGMGTQMVTQLIERLGDADGMILEVEIPDASSDDYEVAVRRLAFWERNGFVLQPQRYEYRSIPGITYGVMLRMAPGKTVSLPEDSLAVRNINREFAKASYQAVEA